MEVSITINGLFIDHSVDTMLRARIITPPSFELDVDGCGQSCELARYYSYISGANLGILGHQLHMGWPQPSGGIIDIHNTKGSDDAAG